MGLFMKSLNEMGSTPMLTSFFRAGFAALFVGLFCLLFHGKEAFKLKKSLFAFAAISGMIGVVIFNICYNLAVMRVGVAVAAVLLYTSPIFTCILSMIVFKEKITPNKYLAIAINICGCFLTVTNGVIKLEHLSLFGIACGVMAGFAMSCMTILVKIGTDRGANPVAFSFYGFATAAVVLLFVSRPWAAEAGLISPKYLVLALLLGLISTATPYILYSTGISMVDSMSKVPVVCSVETVVAACVGFVYFDELFGIWKVVGIFLVLFSIVISNYSISKKPV